MSVTDTLLDQSEAALISVMQEFRPRLLKANGVIGHELKADHSPVTELDLAIETAMTEALKAVDPTVGFEGEEHGIQGSRERFWLIDPIDGTEQFIRGLPAYRCMAVLVDEDELQYAFVYDVAKDERYTARKGQGAWCNGKPIKLSQRVTNRALIELLGDLALPETLRIISEMQSRIKGVRLSRDLSHTITGKFEGMLYYHANGSTWDWTPWALLIKEAGGKVANFGSDKYDYHDPNFLAAPAQVFDDLKPIIDKVLE
jgi:myo-inositol-1(or 4)-monophosphatase